MCDGHKLLFELMIMPKPKSDFVIKIQFQTFASSIAATVDANRNDGVDELNLRATKRMLKCVYIQFRTIELSQPKANVHIQAYAQINYKSLNSVCDACMVFFYVVVFVHILVQ